MGFLKEIDGKTCHFYSKPRHVTPQIDHLGKMSPVLRVSTHIYGISQGHRWEKVHFYNKPRHVTPANGLSRKNDHCSEGFNTHGVSQEIDGKTFIF